MKSRKINQRKNSKAVKRIGFVGAGNMGSALIQSLLNSETDKKTNKKKITIFDLNPKSKKRFSQADHSDINWCESTEEVISQSSILFLCIKPKDVKEFFDTHRPFFSQNPSQNPIIISIIAGLTIPSLRKTAGFPKLKVCRIMPNLAATIGQGAGTVTYSRNITAEEKKQLQMILSASGLYIETAESLVNAVTAISGCGPAFVFLFIEALTQAGIKLKIPRKQALRFAVETVIGSATLLKTLKHKPNNGPLELTAQVSSPGGMTIEGVNRLNESDFKEVVMDAVFRAHAKSQLLFK